MLTSFWWDDESGVLRPPSTSLRMKKATQIFKDCVDIRKIFVFLTAIIVTANIAYASIVINQVLYNPEGTESGGEAVELYNNGDEDVDISGWVLKTEASQNDAVIPDNTIICPGCYYLIADSGWNESKDNETWAEADHQEPLNLFNSNSGVALVNNNTPIDALGWGDEADIEGGLYEGEPADEANEGYALVRDDDTNNNLNDFSSSYPSFRSSSDMGTGTHSEEIGITLNIRENANITSINVTPDEGLSGGIQVFPNPGGAKTVNVKAAVEGEVGNITASFNGITQVMVLQDDSYISSFELAHDLPPGKYNITVNAGGTEDAVEFEYMELVSISVSGNIEFDEVEAGTSIEDEITVENIGNTAVDIGLLFTPLMSEDRAISQKNIEYSMGGEYYQMSSNTQIRKANLAPGEKKDISIKIKIPETASGEYSGKITIIGVGAD